MAEVRLESVTKRFKEAVAVADFSVRVAQGEFVALLGPSGCGKTTTLRMVAGFVEPTAGEIYIGDRLACAPARGVFVPPEERRIGMVFQSYAVWPHMTVFANVAYPLKIKRLPRAEIRQRVERMLELTRLAGLGDRQPHRLSGGQQQRVALARALVMEPAVLLLDEPLSNLDARLREEMRFEIKDLQRRVGVTIIYVTHDQAEAMAMSDRVLVMNAGRVHQVGTPQQIYEQPADRFVTDFVGLANFLPCRVADDRSGVLLGDGPGGPRIACPVPPAVTGPALVAIRPEHVRLTREPGEVRGTVSRRVYLGRLIDYRIRLGNLELRAEAPAGAPFAEGDAVALTIERALVFPRTA
jgi:iron(III) transport system ATP-binding protein